MSRRISVEIVGDESSLRKSFSRASHSATTFNRDIGKATRGALAGSGVFHQLGRSLAFASGGFIAFATVGEAIRSSIDAAVDAAATQRQLAAQLHASGLSYQTYRGEIDKTNLHLSALSGFTKDDLDKSFTTIVRGTGNVSKALTYTALAADIARGRHISLTTASVAVGKAAAGSTTALKRLGIQLPKGATGAQALAKATRLFSGQAQAGATAQQRFAAVLHDTEVIVGTGLLPTVNRLLIRGTAWLDQMNQSGRLQHDVAVATKFLGEAMSGVISVGRTAAHVFRTIGDAVGGTKNEVKLLFGLWAGFKVAKLVGALGEVATAFFGVAAAEEAAAVAGGGGLPGISKAGKLAKFAKAALKLAPAAAAGAALAYGQKDESNNDQPPGTVKLPNGLYADPKTGHYAYTINGQKYNGPKVPDGMMPRNAFGGITSGKGQHGALLTNRHSDPTATLLSATHRKGVSLQGRFNLAEYGLAKAAMTASQADDRRILVTEAAITQQQIKQAKTLAEKTKLANQLADITAKIRGIDQDAASKEADRKEKLKEKLKAAREKASQFNIPLSLQVADARAGALAPTGQSSLTDLQVSIQKKIKAAALKALKSGRLALQGQIDAWNAIASVNQQLAGQSKHGKSTYHRAGAHVLTAGLGLSRNERVALEQRISQSQAHRGYVPDGATANGVVVTGDIHVHGVKNVDDLMNQLQRKARQGAAQRRGRHPGHNTGLS